MGFGVNRLSEWTICGERYRDEIDKDHFDLNRVSGA